MFQVSQAVAYIFTYNNFCLILDYLCSTGNNVTFHSLATQQTGKLLDISKLTTQCVSTEYIVR